MVFGVEFSMISKKQMGKITFFIIASALLDFLWLFYYFIHWTDSSPYEGNSKHSFRKVATFLSFIIFLIKVFYKLNRNFTDFDVLLWVANLYNLQNVLNKHTQPD